MISFSHLCSFVFTAPLPSPSPTPGWGSTVRKFLRSVSSSSSSRSQSRRSETVPFTDYEDEADEEEAEEQEEGEQEAEEEGAEEAAEEAAEEGAEEEEAEEVVPMPEAKVLQDGQNLITAAWEQYMKVVDAAEVVVRMGFWPACSHKRYNSREDLNFLNEAGELQMRADEVDKIAAVCPSSQHTEDENESTKHKREQLIALVKRARRLGREFDKKNRFYIVEPNWGHQRLTQEQKLTAEAWLRQKRSDILIKAEVPLDVYRLHMRGHGGDQLKHCGLDDPPIAGPERWFRPIPTGKRQSSIAEQIGITPEQYGYGTQYGTHGFGPSHQRIRAGFEEEKDPLDWKALQFSSPCESPNSSSVQSPRHSGSRHSSRRFPAYHHGYETYEGDWSPTQQYSNPTSPLQFDHQTGQHEVTSYSHSGGWHVNTYGHEAGPSYSNAPDSPSTANQYSSNHHYYRE